jgi:DNA-binding NarL/FixJ family response regulator
MDQSTSAARERMGLVATNRMRIAGFQAIFGDACGVEFFQIDVNSVHRSRTAEIVLIDAESVGSLFRVLSLMRYRSPLTRALVIDQETTRDADSAYIERVIRAGAKGYLGASATLEEFRSALESLREGGLWAPRKVLSRLIQTRWDEDSAGESVRFTPRESEVIGLLLGGRSNRDIGENLGIDPGTVKAHLGRIMRKAGVGNRIELTMFALNRRPDGGLDRRARGQTRPGHDA